jgi:ribosomal protein S27E
MDEKLVCENCKNQCVFKKSGLYVKPNKCPNNPIEWGIKKVI